MSDKGDSDDGVFSGLPLGVEVAERRGDAAREATCERMSRASVVLDERAPRGDIDVRVVEL